MKSHAWFICLISTYVTHFAVGLYSGSICRDRTFFSYLRICFDINKQFIVSVTFILGFNLEVFFFNQIVKNKIKNRTRALLTQQSIVSSPTCLSVQSVWLKKNLEEKKTKTKTNKYDVTHLFFFYIKSIHIYLYDFMILKSYGSVSISK